MNIQDAIFHRRSIRKYTDGPVSDEQMTRILEAAMMAPSAGNAQPWQFVVVRAKEKLARIKDINPYAGMAEKAPVGVLVCGDLSLEKYPGFFPALQPFRKCSRHRLRRSRSCRVIS